MHRKTKTLLFLFFLLFYRPVFCQDSLKTVIPVNISYFGETLIHPGFSCSYEKKVYKNFLLNTQVGGYLQYRNHFGIFVDASMLWRKTFKCGYSMQYGLGLGYLHTWEHGGKTYTVDDNGNVETKFKWGHPSFMPSLTLGFLGWDFSIKKHLPFRINVDGVLFGQYPFNHFMMPHFAIRTGVTYYIKPKL
jgi:hypothetical protein